MGLLSFNSSKYLSSGNNWLDRNSARKEGMIVRFSPYLLRASITRERSSHLMVASSNIGSSSSRNCSSFTIISSSSAITFFSDSFRVSNVAGNWKIYYNKNKTQY